MGALHERDPGIAKLGGEPTKALALRAMRASAAALFAHPAEPSSWEPRKLNQWQAQLGAELHSSHIQLVATPITIVYQEGTSIGPGLASTYAAITTVTLGKVPT